MKHVVSILVLAVALATCASAATTDAPQAGLAWRQVGVFSGRITAYCMGSFAGDANGPRTEFAPCTARGLRELPSATGTKVVATEGRYWEWPVITGPIDVGSGAAFDLPIRWVYETDNLVAGQPFAELGQTFVATGSELAKISWFVATGSDEFDVVIRKDGPKGDPVGLASSFESLGSPPGIRESQPSGITVWQPGQVLLEVGKTYYVGIKSRSGTPFSMYLHSTGDVYPAGCAYFDGVPEPNSDLGLLIALQSDAAIRSPVQFSTKGDGWVLHTKGVYFKARSANIRAAYVTIKQKGLPEKFDALIRCSRLNADSTLQRVGSDKTCGAIADCERFVAAAVYGPNELPVVPGQTYYLEVTLNGEGVPADARPDLLVDVYGEKTPGMTPVIYNQKITAIASTSVAVSWSGAVGCKTRINYGITPNNLGFVIDVPKGAQQADIHPIRPGQRFFFKITAQTQSGGSFETPVYVARTLDAQNKPVTDPPLPATPREDFLALAPMDELFEPSFEAPKKVVSVEVANSAFEDGLKGWLILPEKSAEASSIASDGKFSAGWDSASPSAGQFPKESTVYQTVDVTPGKWYVLSAYLKTDQAAPATDLWARLVCDPKGGTDFTGFNSTQWLRTGGKWLKFSKYWKAAGRTMTVGVGFTRGDGKYVAALADSITLVEVKESPFLKRLIGK